MTAKHRKGKSNHKHEDNFFKNEVVEAEARSGGNPYTLFLVLLVLLLVGGFAGSWFCFQQHQTLTSLTDNLAGIQVKIVKLQSSHEDLRLSNKKQISESVEDRLTALEESYALAQKRVGMALAAAEQLKVSDLPAQVLSLQTEMKARLAAMQRATVPLEQLSQLQSLLTGKNEELEEVRVQVEGLAVINGELSQKADVLTKSLGEGESKLEEQDAQLATLGATLDGQATEMSRLGERLGTYQAQVLASVLEMAAIRELLENEPSQPLQEPRQEEQLNVQVEETQPITEPLEHTEEEETEAAGEEEATAAGTAEEEEAADAGAAEEEEEEAADAGAAEEEEAVDAGAAEEEEAAAAATTGEEDATVAGETEDMIVAEATEEDEEEQTPPAAQAQGSFFLQEERAKVDEEEEEEVDSEGATPVEHEDTLPGEEVEAAKEGEKEQEESVAAGKEEVDTTHAEEETQGVEEHNQEADEEKIQVESVVEEENQEEEEEEGEEVQIDVLVRDENDLADSSEIPRLQMEFEVEEEQGEAGEEEPHEEEDEASPEDEEWNMK